MRTKNNTHTYKQTNKQTHKNTNTRIQRCSRLDVVLSKGKKKTKLSKIPIWSCRSHLANAQWVKSGLNVGMDYALFFRCNSTKQLGKVMLLFTTSCICKLLFRYCTGPRTCAGFSITSCCPISWRIFFKFSACGFEYNYYLQLYIEEVYRNAMLLSSDLCRSERCPIATT